MKRFVLCFILSFVLTTVMYSQRNMRVRVMNSSSADSTSVAELFDGYDFSDVPTGYLSEAGMPELNLSYFDIASGNCPSVDFPILYSMVESLQSMDVSVGRTWPSNLFPGHFNETPTNFSLWIAAYQFNSFSSSAEDYIQLVNGRFVKNPSASSSNLYSTNTLLAFAPGVSSITEGSVLLTCRMTENSIPIFNYLLFDADDGLGPRPINLSQAIPVTYSTSGLKNLSLSFVGPYGTFTAHSSLYVKEQTQLTPQPNSLPFLSFSGTFYGYDVKARLSYRTCLTSGHSHRPLIIVEGFDPIGLLDKGIYGWTNYGEISGALSESGILNQFDVYYIDWLNSEADIRANAQLLKQIIAHINQEKHDMGSTEGTVIVAQSMGGLITQVALNEMEANHETHEVTHYFSHDVPYHGATVPPGAIYALQSLRDYLRTTNISKYFTEDSASELFDKVQNLKRYLYSTSAQQMLINYIDSTGSVDHTRFNELQQILNARGLPKGDPDRPIVNIAVSNGGSSDAFIQQLQLFDNQLLSLYLFLDPLHLASILLNYTGDDFGAGILAWLPGPTNYHYSLNVYPHSSSNQLLSHFVGTYSTHILFWDVQKTFVDDAKYAPSIPARDLTNGSYYLLPQLRVNPDDPYAGMSFWKHLLVGLFANPSIQMQLTPKIQFIPTYSSLRNHDGINNPSRDYLGNPLTYSTCSFDGYFLPDTSQYHTSCFPWSSVNDQTSIYVDCPDTLHVGDILRLANYIGSVSWNCDSRFMTINHSTGWIQDIISERDIEVIGYNYTNSNRSFLSRKKIVHIIPRDTPPIYLEPHFYGDTLAIELHSPNPIVDARLQTHDIQRTWFYKWDLQPLVEHYDHALVKMTILRESLEMAHYKLTVAAHVTDPELGYHSHFVDFSFWNNQRITLIQPASIVFNQQVAFMTVAGQFGYWPLSPSAPFVVYLNPEQSGDYTDRLITSDVSFRNPLGVEFPCMLNSSNYWIAPSFFGDGSTLYALESLFQTLEDGEVGTFIVEMINADGGDPVQTFLIPVLRNDNISF